MRALVVETDLKVAMVVTGALLRRGVRVQVAASLPPVEELSDCDLIIVNARKLPGCTKPNHRTSAHPMRRVPIIALADGTNVVDAMQAWAKGEITAYVCLPLNADELALELDAVIGRPRAPATPMWQTRGGVPVVDLASMRPLGSA